MATAVPAVRARPGVALVDAHGVSTGQAANGVDRCAELVGSFRPGVGADRGEQLLDVRDRCEQLLTIDRGAVSGCWHADILADVSAKADGCDPARP
jgi:hypothetical protein